MNNDLPIEQVPVSFLPNPYKTNIWGTQRFVALNGVKQCLLKNKLQQTPFDVANCELGAWSAEDHEQRIAFLVINHDQTPISLDVGVFYFNYNFMQDGYHRLSAAIYRNETHIPGMFSGNIDLIKEFMRGMHCDLYK